MPDNLQQHKTHLLVIYVALLLLGLAALWRTRKRIPVAAKPTAVIDRFSSELITQTFISALPSLTRELNLELATTTQTEFVERLDVKKFLGISLGTNQVRIQAKVTYRYHIRLHDAWQLSVKGKAVIVRAPPIRASLPPAIHTDTFQMESKRGWCRLPPVDMADQLQNDLTAILCQYAEDPRRLDLVRQTARESVADFVRLWLEKENRWNAQSFTSIQVQFHGEGLLPDHPTLQLG